MARLQITRVKVWITLAAKQKKTKQNKKMNSSLKALSYFLECGCGDFCIFGLKSISEVLYCRVNNVLSDVRLDCNEMHDPLSHEIEFMDSSPDIFL